MTESDTSTAVAPAVQRVDNPASDSALHSLLPHLLKVIKREPAFGITVAYLLVAMAGIFYNYRFYGKFQIPVLSLSQISDFLTAGIQHPIALVLVLTTFPLIWLFDWINVRSRRRYRLALERAHDGGGSGWQQRWRRRWFKWNAEFGDRLWIHQAAYFFVIVVYGWNFVAIYAGYQAERVRNGEAEQVRIRLNGSEADLAASKSPTWTYLGAVSNYVFVYDAAAKQSLILPTNNIMRIQPVRPAAKTDAAKAEPAKAEPAKADSAGEVAPKP